MKKRASLRPIQLQTKAALLLSGCLFILFLSAMPMGQTWGDSPELAGSAWVLGIPHPTGYPFYMLAVHMFQCIPIGSVIFRAHLFSVFCSAAACAILFLWLYESLIRQGYERKTVLFAGCVSTIAFALTSTVWSQSLIAEVYTLFALLFLMTLYYFHRSLENPQKFLPALFFLFGLHIIHHRLALFLIVLTLLFLLLHQSQKIKSLLQCPSPVQSITAKQFVRYLSALFPPLLFWLYFPLRARVDPPINWFNPDSLSRAMELINGGQFSRILQEGLGRALSNLSFLQVISAYSIPLLLYGPAAIMIVYGLYTLARRQRGMALYLVLLYGIYQSFYMVYITGDRHVFLLPALILLVYPLALGMASIIKIMFSFQMNTRQQWLTRIILAAVCITPLWIDYQEPTAQGRGIYPLTISSLIDRYRYRWDSSAQQYAQEIWKHAKSGEIILTGLWEPTADNEYFPLLYQKHVEQRGQNNIIIGAGFLMYDWYREQINTELKHPLELRGDRMMPTREAWLENVWQTIIMPNLETTSILVTTQRLPPSWYSRTKVEEVGPIQIDTRYIPRDYRMYTPSGFLYRISQRPIE